MMNNTSRFLFSMKGKKRKIIMVMHIYNEKSLFVEIIRKLQKQKGKQYMDFPSGPPRQY